MNSSSVQIDVGTDVTAAEVLAVREETDSAELRQRWTLCIQQSLAVATARETATGRLVGIGFLVGNVRHAEIVDLTVHSSARGQAIGSSILDRLIALAREQDVLYLSLTFDKKTPWLQQFYSRHGFQSIDFAMWHEQSLHSAGE